MKPLFRKGQVIAHKNFPASYVVLKTPVECNHNGKPSYQLQQRTGPKTSPFYRSQEDVEKFWKDGE